MGQIVGLNAKCKRANLNALGSIPTPAAGEYILVSSDNSMNAAGQGNFDCYIVGDGETAATGLKLHNERNELLKKLVPEMTVAQADVEWVTTNRLLIGNDGIIATAGNTYYRVVYAKRSFSKGDIIHFEGVATTSKIQRFGWTKTAPASLETLVGLQLDDLFYFSDTTHSYDVTAPYDDAYFVYYYYNQDWSTRAFTFYLSDYILGLGAVDGAFDISVYNAESGVAKSYETLALALAGVPSAKKEGGMSVKFIQLTPASYSVVKTEGVEAEPAGTEVQETLAVGSGSYTAEQLDGITLPAAVGESVTYWLAVTETVDEQEVTTYTTWVITYASAVSQKYVQYRLMSTAWSTAVGNWQGEDSEPVAGSRNLVVSGGVCNAINEAALDNYSKVDSTVTQVNFALLNTGKFSTSTNYRHCYIPVNAGEKYIIRGYSPCRYALATSEKYSAGGNVPLVEGTTVYEALTEDYYTITIPEGCTWLLLNNFKKFNNVWKWNGAIKEQIDTSIAETERKLSETYEEVEVIDLEDVENLPMRKGIFTYGVWESTTASYYHLIFDVFGDDCLLRITASDENNGYVAFVSNLDLAYKDDDVPLVDGTSVIAVAKGDTQFIPVPKEAVAVIVYMGTSTENAYPYKPNAITIYRNRNVRNTDGVAITAERLYGEEHYTSMNRSAHSYAVKVRKGDSLDVSAERSSGGTIIYMGFTDTIPREDVPIYDNYGSQNYDYIFRKNVVASVDGWFVCLSNGEVLFEVTSHRSTAADAIALRDNAVLNKLLAGLNFEQIDLSSLNKYSMALLANGVYGNSSAYRITFVDVRNASFIKITAKGSYSSRFCFVSEIGTPTWGGTPEYAPSSQGVIIISAGKTKVLEVPDDANYVLVYLGSPDDSYPYAPASFKVYGNTQNESNFTSYEQLIVDFNSRRDRQVSDMLAIGLSPLNPATDSEGWELPTTLQQLNVQRKSEQLVNIRWTPKLNVPSKKRGTFPAGTQVTSGIPYSSNNDDGSKVVGEEVSLHTFMTAVDNPYSLLYTECVNNENTVPSSSIPLAPTQKSYWGKVYTMSNNGFAYYGTVCCGFTSSVENAPLKWNNGVIRNYTLTNGIYVPVSPTGTVDFNLIKIGDVCDNTSHSFLVYGLHRDANGEVDKVKIAESTSNYANGGCRFVTYSSRDAFKTLAKTFTVFRYMKLWDNTDYEASEYVPLTDRGETATTVTYNNAICTFAGDKCTFRETDLVVINYNLYGEQAHEWTKIQVYKDEVLLGEYTLAEAEQTLVDYLADNSITPNPFNEEIDEHNHALVLGKELNAGMYKACMSDGTNISDYTYWEIISNGVTVIEKDTDEYEVTVGGQYLIQAIYVNGIGMYYLPTYEEQTARKFTLRPQALSKLFGKSYEGYEVSVKLKGEYGNATTVPVKIQGGDVEPEDEEDDTD